MLFMPLIVPFYLENGLRGQDVFTLQAIYSIAIVVAEVPSGYLSDFWGRKNTIVLGSFLGFIGFFTYSFSYGFTGFLIAELILGLGQSMVSGADSALLYDTLKSKNQELKYVKHEGRISGTGNFAEAIAGISASFIVAWGLRYTVYFQSLVALIAIPASFMLIEPEIISRKVKLSIKEFTGIIKDTLYINKELRRRIFFSSVIGSATLSMAWFAQLFFNEIGVPVKFYPILWTGLNLIIVPFSFFAYKIENRLGRINTLILIAFFVVSGYVFNACFLSYYGIVMLFVFYSVRGIATPVLKNYINERVTSNNRATVLSIRNLFIRIIFASIAPVFGYISGHFSLSMALILGGSFFFVLLLLLILPEVIYGRFNNKVKS
jgi:MFS family permease